MGRLPSSVSLCRQGSSAQWAREKLLTRVFRTSANFYDYQRGQLKDFSRREQAHPKDTLLDQAKQADKAFHFPLFIKNNL